MLLLALVASAPRPRLVLGACSLLSLAACFGQVDPESGAPVGVSSPLGIGDPCVPSLEKQPGFPGFHEDEVAIETSSRSCRTGVCLVNHFRGRVSCPYGGSPPGSCATPGGAGVGRESFVEPQCVERPAKLAVHCSCRCANAMGRTDDGGSYCACGEGFVCESLVAPIPGEEAIAGSYCVRAEARTATCRRSCSRSDPSTRCER